MIDSIEAAEVLDWFCKKTAAGFDVINDMTSIDLEYSMHTEQEIYNELADLALKDKVKNT